MLLTSYSVYCKFKFGPVQLFKFYKTFRNNRSCLPKINSKVPLFLAGQRLYLVPPKRRHVQDVAFIDRAFHCRSFTKFRKILVVRTGNVNRRHYHRCTVQQFFLGKCSRLFIVIENGLLNVALVQSLVVVRFEQSEIF